ncbi:MAG TPA: hypothetical protein PLY51_04470 [Microthrixaceae bacterium]|nr:hypothetical protein [Microthrixaceae bacterium]
MGRERRVDVIIGGDAKGFQRAVGDADDSTTGFGSKLGGWASKAAGAIATAFAVDKVVDWGGQLLNTGQQLDAWNTKVNTVFGSSAGDVRQWADKSNEALGLTNDQLAGMAAGMGDLLVPMGFTRQAAADMSMKAMDLSGALSAWSGGTKSTAEVSDILTKAMLGETDGLKGLGISISAADIQQRLAAEGKDKLTGAALEQAKAEATLQLVMEKSTDAQKAWTDGSMDSVQKTNALKASFAEAKETLAQAVVPALQAVVGWLADSVIPAVRDLAQQWLPPLKAAFQVIADHIRDAWPTVKAVLAAVFDWIANTAWPALKTAFEGMATVIKAVADAVQTAWPTIRSIIEGVYNFIANTVWPGLKTAFEGIANVVTALADGIRSRWDDIRTAIDTAVTAIKITLGIMFAPILIAWKLFHDQILTIVQGAWNTIRGVFETVWNAIRGVVEGAMNVIKGVIDTILGILSGNWSRAWDGLKSIAQGIWQGIISWILAIPEMVFKALVGLVKILADLATDAFNGLWNAAKNVWSTVIGWITGLPQAAWDAFKSLIELLGKLATDAFNGLWDAAKGIWSTVIGWITGLPQAAWDAFVAIVEKLTTIASDAWNAFWDTAKGIWSTVIGWITGLPQAAWDAIVDIVNKLRQVASDAWNALWDSAKSVWSSVIGWITGLPQAAWNAILGLVSKLAEMGLKAWNALWDAAKNIWSSVTGWITGLPAEAWDKIKEIITKLYKAGKDAMQGLWDGLKEIWEKVKGWFEGIVGWLDDRWEDIKKTFGFGKGELQDMADKAKKVQDALASIREQIKNMPTIPHAPGSKYAKGGVVTAPTVGLIGEAGDNEAVIPLTANVLAGIGRGIAAATWRQPTAGPPPATAPIMPAAGTVVRIDNVTFMGRLTRSEADAQVEVLIDAIRRAQRRVA